MTLPTSRLAYHDCFEAMDAALADPRGARIKTPDAGHLRMRMHQGRNLDRKENAQTYEEGHPLHGRSIYDKLVLRVKIIKSETYLYIEQIKLNGEIESLANVTDDEPDPPMTLSYESPKEIGQQPRLALDFKRRV